MPFPHPDKQDEMLPLSAASRAWSKSVPMSALGPSVGQDRDRLEGTRFHHQLRPTGHRQGLIERSRLQKVLSSTLSGTSWSLPSRKTGRTCQSSRWESGVKRGCWGMPKRTRHTWPATVLLFGPNDDRAQGRGNSDALRLELIHLNWRSRTPGVNTIIGIRMVTSPTRVFISVGTRYRL